MRGILERVVGMTIVNPLSSLYDTHKPIRFELDNHFADADKIIKL